MIQMYQKPLKGKQVGVVLGAFAPLHQGHLDLIMQAKKENDGGCLVIVCGGEGDKGEPVDLPFKRRYRYVREFFAKDDLVAVFGINDTEMGVPDYPNGWDRWLEVFNQIAEENTSTPNEKKPELIFYVGEPSYKEALEKRGYNAILIEQGRPQPERLQLLNRLAIRQLEKIQEINVDTIKKLGKQDNK